MLWTVKVIQSGQPKVKHFVPVLILQLNNWVVKRTNWYFLNIFIFIILLFNSTSDNQWISTIICFPIYESDYLFFNTPNTITTYRDCCVDRMVVGFTSQLPVQSMPITSKVVSSNPAHDEVYSIQHYVIKFVIDLRQVNGFLRVLWFPPSIKLKYCWKWC